MTRQYLKVLGPLHKTMGIATVRKLASKQALGLEALLVTIGDLTAFWHVPIPIL